MVLSPNGQWRLESTGNLFELTHTGQQAWRVELQIRQAERRAYLSDSGWSVVETQGQDWGEVIVLSPQGVICTRVAVTDCENRSTWPPSHLHQVVLSPGSWPWNDGGSTPHFFAAHEGNEFFWWLLGMDQRVAFGFRPARLMDWPEIESLKAVMARHERQWALSLLGEHSGTATVLLRAALSVVVHQRCVDALPLLHSLRDRWERGEIRAALVRPHPCLCPGDGLLKLALWKLNAESGPELPDLTGLNAEEVCALAGPPDHVGWWRSDDRSEKGEFWDYYQPAQEVIRIFWHPDHFGDKVRHLARDDVSTYWTDFRAGQLFKGWLENRCGPSLYSDYPPAEPQNRSVQQLVVNLEEIQTIEIYGHRLNLFGIPSQKLVLPGPYESGGPVGKLLEALQSPYPEPSPTQFGWSRPRLLVEFSYCCTGDNPSFLVRLHLSSGRLLQLKTDSYFSHMLPWRFRLDNLEVVETYNREISLAVAELLTEEFLDRNRLLEFGRFLERDPDDRLPAEARLSNYQPRPKPTGPNALDEDGKTALMRASKEEELFEALLKQGANLEIRGQQGLTGLQMACLWEGTAEVERWLRYGANLETRSESGQTPLMLVANRPQLLQLLLDHGAQVNATEADGDTALDHAVYAQNLESIELLLAAGASSTRARDHALRRLARAEFEMERHLAYKGFHTPEERRRRAAEMEPELADLREKYPDLDLMRNPYEDDVTRARRVLARIEGPPT